ncbi:MAG: hypothetical protein AAGH76_07000 [Pseudomonadota bacterium]
MTDPLGLFGAFAAGLVVARIAGAVLARHAREQGRAGARLAPDQTIAALRRSLTATRQAVAERDSSLAEFRSAYERRAQELDALRDEVRDAVRLTRELRSELIERIHTRIRQEVGAVASSLPPSA